MTTRERVQTLLRVRPMHESRLGRNWNCEDVQSKSSPRRRSHQHRAGMPTRLSSAVAPWRRRLRAASGAHSAAPHHPADTSRHSIKRHPRRTRQQSERTAYPHIHALPSRRRNVPQRHPLASPRPHGPPLNTAPHHTLTSHSHKGWMAGRRSPRVSTFRDAVRRL